MSVFNLCHECVDLCHECVDLCHDCVDLYPDNCTAGDYWIQLFLGRAEDSDVKSEARFIRVANS